MKRIFTAIMGAALLLTACTKNEMPQLDQNPYRATVDYTPGSCQMTVAGTLTPDESYDWITVSQSGGSATFTVRRNTTGIIRTAVFSIAGESYKAKVFQKAHSLDADVNAVILGQGLGSVELAVELSTDYSEDYASWGVLYGKTSDISKAVDAPQKGAPCVGKNLATIKNLEEGADYYFWGYVTSTEDDDVVSDVTAAISPVYVKAGENLQSAIDGAKEFAEIRVQGGATFAGGIKMMNDNANKSISGGWNSDFSEQSTDNLTVIDGGGENRGFWCAGDDSDNPLQGYARISYFEVKNCKGDHGSAVHVCGGPVTVHHCLFCENESEKGAVGTREEEYSSDITVYNCIFRDNIAKNGHGAALGFGDGASYEDPVHAVVVNNLIVNNTCLAHDGYCSTFICYNSTELIFVNNTVVGNKSFANDDDEQSSYPGTNFRGNVRALLANNMFVGNLMTPNVDQPVYTRQDGHLGMGGGWGTLANNIVEGSVSDSDNITFENHYPQTLGFDLKTVLADPDNGDYTPVGAAVGTGTLSELTYMCEDDHSNGVSYKCSIKKLLEKYSTDLAGNPRTDGTTVCVGCYEK